MGKRGKRATRITNGPGKRTRQDLRRALRKAGNDLEVLRRWCEAEKRGIDDEEARKRFDDAILPTLTIEEENFWRHQRTPEARLLAKQRGQQHEKIELLTREEFIRLTIKPLLPRLGELGIGQSADAIVKRLVRKLHGGDKPPS